jgi:hypothetical protein
MTRIILRTQREVIEGILRRVRIMTAVVKFGGAVLLGVLSATSGVPRVIDLLGRHTNLWFTCLSGCEGIGRKARVVDLLPGS